MDVLWRWQSKTANVSSTNQDKRPLPCHQPRKLLWLTSIDCKPNYWIITHEQQMAEINVSEAECVSWSLWIDCPLTCWRAVVAHRCAGAAPVLVGGLGGEAQGAACSSASSSHVLQVVIGVIHDGGGEAGGDARLRRHGPRHQARSVLHLVRPVAERHHLTKNNMKSYHNCTENIRDRLYES